MMMMVSSRASVTEAEKSVLKNQLASLEPFKALRDTMPLQYVTAFLLVAMEEGHSVSEYARRLGISPSLMTRHLSDLGDTNRYHEAGFGLVEHYDDPKDKRFRFVRLTPKGRGVVGQIVRALSR